MRQLKPLILYFTADFPSREVLESFINETDPGIVKYVELGVPIENPIYDGPTIKTTHSRARNQFTMDDLRHFAGLLSSRGIESYILAYHDLVQEKGEEFLDFLRDCGYSGIIVPDLLTDFYDERIEFIRMVEERIRFIPFFNPATPDAVIQEILAETGSWVYYGLQPSTGIDVPYDLDEVSRRIVELAGDREVNFGFGIRTVGQVKEIISHGSSGVAIGSMQVRMLSDGDIAGFRNFQSELGRMIRVAD